jgi:hypothetical protein
VQQEQEEGGEGCAQQDRQPRRQEEQWGSGIGQQSIDSDSSSVSNAGDQQPGRLGAGEVQQRHGLRVPPPPRSRGAGKVMPGAASGWMNLASAQQPMVRGGGGGKALPWDSFWPGLGGWGAKARRR